MSVRMNRDLRASHLPAVTVSDLEPPGGGRPLAWSKVWRFARSFDPGEYTAATGRQLDTSELLRRARAAPPGGLQGDVAQLRTMLSALYWDVGQGASVAASDALVCDAILDALFTRLGGEGARPHDDIGPHEPGIGTFGASIGSDQSRLEFVAARLMDRRSLYDCVAGLLLREIRAYATVVSLYLYPPEYPSEEEDRRPKHVFMVLLESRAGRDVNSGSLPEEYQRLARMAIEAFGDCHADHSPGARALPARDFRG